MDTNNQLRTARQLIDCNDLSSAIEICRNVLKENKNNYMALILLGVALADHKDAVKQFLKAISLKPTSVLGYQGLAKYYEQSTDQDDLKKLCKIYCEMYKLNGIDYASLCESFHKAASKHPNVVYFCNLLIQLIENESNENNKYSFITLLVSILTNVDENGDLQEVFNLFELVNKKYFDHKTDAYILKYFICLNRIKSFNEVIHIYFSNFFNKSSCVIMEWIYSSFIEKIILQTEEITEYELLSKNIENSAINSNIKYLCQAIFCYINNQFLNAYLTAMRISSDLKNTNSLVTIFYAQCCIKLCRWLEAENIARSYTDHKNSDYANAAKHILFFSLCRQQETSKSTEAINLFNTFSKQNLKEAHYISFFHANINHESYSAADKCLKEYLVNSEYYLVLLSIYFDKNNDRKKAIEILNGDKNNIHSLLQLGLLQYSAGDYKCAFEILMQVARFTPNNYEIYYHLGNFYFLNENFEKAKKCFLKTIELNPECIDASKKLNKIYTQFKDWESNYTLLNSVINTGALIKGYQFQWAWLQLGLHHLALEQWDNAILNLRTYIGLNSHDINAWITLANAYHCRGSYTSALKCYRKAIDIDPDKKQCYIIIGTIQCLLGQFTEALKTFEEISDIYLLPKLKGLAEVKICIAIENFDQKLFGLSRDNAVSAVLLISKAISINNKIICFWQILYHALMTLTRLPTNYNWIYFDYLNASDIEHNKNRISGFEIFDCCIVIIKKAIGLSKNSNCYLYYDMAATFYKYYEYSNDKCLAEKAFSAIVSCLELEKKRWQYWNLLGIICSSKAITKYNLAQHAFMKAIELDSSNSLIWSNLGVLYLLLDNTRLANQVFKKAQESNPAFVQSWIGQSIIAETYAQEEVLDLFCHATQLGFHKESSSRFAYWVAKTSLCNQDIPLKTWYSLENMHAIPAASDLISTYCLFEEEDPWSHNIHGIILEKLGKYNSAIKSFHTALNCAEPKYKDIIIQNLARLYIKTKRYDVAINLLQNITTHELPSASMVALSLFNCNYLEEAHDAYVEIIEDMKNEPNDYVENLITLAHIAYKSDAYEQSKMILYQCLERSENIDYEDMATTCSTFLALCSISLLASDVTTAIATIKYIETLSRELIAPYLKILLKTYYYYKYISHSAARTYLSKLIHIYPYDSQLWQLMMKISIDNMSIANTCSQKTLGNGDTVNCKSSLKIACITEMLMGNKRKSLYFAQKAIHMNPTNENFSLLKKIINVTDILDT